MAPACEAGCGVTRPSRELPLIRHACFRRPVGGKAARPGAPVADSGNPLALPGPLRARFIVADDWQLGFHARPHRPPCQPHRQDPVQPGREERPTTYRALTHTLRDRTKDSGVVLLDPHPIDGLLTEMSGVFKSEEEKVPRILGASRPASAGLARRGPGLTGLERISAALPAINAADRVRHSPERCIIAHVLTRVQDGRRGRGGRANGNRSLLSGCYPRPCEHQGGPGRGCWPAMLAPPSDEPSHSGA